MLLDIHSHILPCVDDGPQNLEDAVKLIDIMRSQGITHVIATPHFYPSDDTLEDFKSRVKESVKLLKSADVPLPDIIIGCELFYFNGISRSEHIREFTIGGSNYILIEPNPFFIGKTLMNELLYLRDDLKITPIIAHIERYQKSKNYKEFIKFIKENNILCQVNASSFLDRKYTRIIKKLFKENIVTYIATDTHSLNRPPMMTEALHIIEERFSPLHKQRILSNLEALYGEITAKGENQ